MELYDRIVDKKLLVRRISITANHVVDENSVIKADAFEQLDLFTDYNALQKNAPNKKRNLNARNGRKRLW